VNRLQYKEDRLARLKDNISLAATCKIVRVSRLLISLLLR
jgi:hypothetical protein